MRDEIAKAQPPRRTKPWMRWFLMVGVVATAVCVSGDSFPGRSFFMRICSPICFLLGLPLGSLALVMIHHLTGGAWGLLVRRIAEAQMKTLPLMALLFMPIGFGLRYIYRWAILPPLAADAITPFKNDISNQIFLLAGCRLFFGLAGIGVFVEPLVAKAR